MLILKKQLIGRLGDAVRSQMVTSWFFSEQNDAVGFAKRAWFRRWCFDVAFITTFVMLGKELPLLTMLVHRIASSSIFLSVAVFLLLIIGDGARLGASFLGATFFSGIPWLEGVRCFPILFDSKLRTSNTFMKKIAYHLSSFLI